MSDRQLLRRMAVENYREALAGGIGTGIGTGVGLALPLTLLSALATVATGAASAVLAWYALRFVE